MMSASPMSLTRAGLRKTAILMMALESERATKIMRHLSDIEAESISAEITRLEYVSPQETEAVIVEFATMIADRTRSIQGGLGFAQQILEDSLGPARAEAIIGRISASAAKMPFHFLQRAEPAILRSFLVEEHPQVIAMVLAHMTADKCALVIQGLPADVQADVAHRIAVMDGCIPEISEAVEQTLERRLSSMLQSNDSSRVGGIEPLVEIINRADRSTERQIVEGLDVLNPELAEEVRSKMFLFEDIVTLDDRSMQLVLRQVEVNAMALSLKGVADSVRDKITSNISERAREALQEEIDVLGPVRLSQVEEAQQNVIRIIRSLEESGDIILRRSSEDEIVA